MHCKNKVVNITTFKVVVKYCDRKSSDVQYNTTCHNTHCFISSIHHYDFTISLHTCVDNQ